MDFSPHITAVLGATNTGKTHYAVERMCARVSGVIGLPLRLLAREVYDKIVEIKGAPACALITGEEKIIPAHASYFVCTVEAMPMDDIRAGKFACVVIDEVQMVAHKQRGHIFTDRLLHARGTEETLLLGADTVRPLIQSLVPKARYVTRERFSVLSYSGHTKLSRLPKRSVVVAFSAGEVYALAELMRRHYGGAALVMGGLSPRTRNAQAELYQSGEVDYLVATDAIGMGLNLDADHVAFASLRKFDGQRRRFLRASEMAQIAGRAGRFRTNGSFGTTGSCLPMDDDIVGRIENHSFEPLRYAEWRNTKLDFSSLETLQDSLAMPPSKPGLRRIAPAPDELALSRLLRVHDVRDYIRTEADVRTFWDVCQIPDFRNLGPEAHARLLEEIFTALYENNNQLTDEYLEQNIRRMDYQEGNVEILSSRLACIRTWTYIAHKKAWVRDTENWIKQTRSVENSLSDALHTKLVQRFVDRRTSALLKGIGAKTQMDATITDKGEVLAEGHKIGYINGLVFTQLKSAGGTETKALAAAAALSLAPEIDRRLTQITGSPHDALSISDKGQIVWSGAPIGKLVPGTHLLSPQIDLLGGELGSPVLRDQAAGRIRDYMRMEITQKFECLFGLKGLSEDTKSFQGARALAHVLFENNGVIRRMDHLQLVRDTDREARGYIRNKSGVFGFRYVFLKDLLKPAPARLMSLLFAFGWDKDGGGRGNPFMPPNGMSSTPSNTSSTEAAINRAGYTRKGPRIIRLDILERLHHLITQATEMRKDNNFQIAQQMLAMLGCSYDDFQGVLIALGYKKITIELTPEECAYEKQRAIGIIGAMDAKQKELEFPEAAKAIIATENEKKEPIPKPPEYDKEEREKYVPKRQRVKPLDVYRPRPQFDENDKLVLPTTTEVWTRDTSRRGPRPNASRGAEEGARGDGTYASTYKVGTGQSTYRSGGYKGKKAPSKADKLSGYANLSDKKARRKPKPQKAWSAKPPTKTKTQQDEDNPFAALSGLTFSDKKKKD